MADRSKTNSQFRFGVSLIEMMIVVAIIGTLISLLIPGIQSVRNSAKKVQNQNNMKQILLAIHTYASNNEGAIPQYTDWPGEDVCFGDYTTTGQPWREGWTVTSTNCTNRLVLKSTTVLHNQKYIRDLTLNAAFTRTDWIQGSPYFLLLPYLDQQNLWDSSYGYMTLGDITATGLGGDGHEGGEINDGWTGISTANKGWQGGRVPAVVKTYVGYGDPTADFPGHPAPLSYPMLAAFNKLNFQPWTDNYSYGSIQKLEDFDGSRQAIITEAYTGCYVSGSDLIQNWLTGSNSRTDLSGVYLSWAASGIHNLVDPTTLTPGYRTVAGGGGLNVQYTLWLGGKSADPQCSSDYYGCSCDELIHSPEFPKGVTDPTGKPIDCNSSFYLFHIPNSSCGSPAYAAEECSHGNDVCCHVGEWASYYPHKVLNRSFWEDHPTYARTYCQVGRPMSLVPGSLNLGMLDGSVRAVDKDISMSAWQSLMNGQAGNDDVEN